MFGDEVGLNLEEVSINLVEYEFVLRSVYL